MGSTSVDLHTLKRDGNRHHDLIFVVAPLAARGRRFPPRFPRERPARSRAAANRNRTKNHLEMKTTTLAPAVRVVVRVLLQSSIPRTKTSPGSSWSIVRTEALACSSSMQGLLFVCLLISVAVLCRWKARNSKGITQHTISVSRAVGG